MKRSGPLLPLWRPSAGLVAAPLAWAAHHQAGSFLNFADCDRGDGMFVAAVGLAALAVAVAGGWLSWRAFGDAGSRTAQPTHRFIAVLGVMTAALLALTIAVQIMAGLVVPACFR